VLAQLDDGLFLTDGGLETVLIFREGRELPAFAAFPLLSGEAGLGALRRYYEPYLELARERGLGFVLESPTWRASRRWGDELGYSRVALDALNRRAIALMDELRDGAERVLISGCVGPSDDAYDPGVALTAREAQDYHAPQIATFAGTTADMVTALTLTYAEEAIGIARAAAEAGIPAVISFTTETDGRLPSGQALGDAIEQVDSETGGSPAYYMVNCAHPTHFEDALTGAPCRERIRGLRANASTRSHAELDASDALDDGDPADLGARYAALAARLPRLSVLGGCCGTDHRHVRAIRDAWPA
jgi:homocysteine S-methyltransferase